jgi:hypothetical protein
MYEMSPLFFSIGHCHLQLLHKQHQHSRGERIEKEADAGSFLKNLLRGCRK